MARNRRLRSWPEDEIDFLAETVGKARPDFIGEWGTNTGASAWLLYHAAHLNGLRRCIVHSVDISEGLAVCDPDEDGKPRGFQVADVPVHLHVGDGATTVLREYAKSGRDEPLFFVDGEHAEDQVRTELERLSAQAPHAVLLLHDTNGEPGVAFSTFVNTYPDRYSWERLDSEHGMISMWPK
jgi:hypothetical protein